MDGRRCLSVSAIILRLRSRLWVQAARASGFQCTTGSAREGVFRSMLRREVMDNRDYPRNHYRIPPCIESAH